MVIWQRDHGRCTFMRLDGARCDERGALEFDHIHPYGDGGDATAANILLCRAHNQYEAEQFLGVWEAPVERTRAGPSGWRELAREGVGMRGGGSGSGGIRAAPGAAWDGAVTTL